MQNPETIPKQEQCEKKRTLWNECKQKLETITDGLGKGVEESILETLVALNVQGFKTEMSCAGHVDGGLPYPWVDVVSPVADAILENEHFKELQRKSNATEPGATPLTEQEETELKSLVQTILDENKKTQERLKQKVREYYGESKALLSVKELGHNRSRLRSAYAIDVSTDKIREAFPSITDEDIEEEMETFRADLNKFGEYLKDTYFASDDILAQGEQN